MINIDRIKIEGDVEFSVILDLKIHISVNEHAVLEVYGFIDSTEEEDYNKIIGKTMIVYYETEGELSPVFKGRIQSSELFFINNTCHLKIKCFSFSYEFHKIKQYRSFQDIHMKYTELLKALAGEGRNIIFCEENRELEKPLIQYGETDWEFCKRIAGKFYSVLVPEVTGSHPQMAIGLIEGKEYEIGNNIGYKLHQNYDALRRKKRVYECSARDSSFYTVFSKENYMLGDKVRFMGARLVVLSKHLFLKQGQAEIEYLLGNIHSMSILPYDNHNLCGLSLEGTVQWGTEEKIKLYLDIDKNREAGQEKLYEFDYAPVSGNLMYALPEHGAKARLYFPNANEASGIVIESICEKRKYPDSSEKTLETKEGKEFKLMNEDIVCKSSSRNMEMSLSDSSGAGILSNKEIRISAHGNVRLQTDGIVSCQNPLGYKFEDSNTGDCMNISGNEITFKTDSALLCALPHKVGKKPVLPKGLDSGIKDPMKYASDILGAIPQSTAASELQSAVLGGIPTYTNPSRRYDVSDLIFLGGKRRT